jgi:PAS domain S-box-containing protein
MKKALRLSESTIAALFEAAGQAIVGVRIDGRIQLVNRRAERMFGYSRSELLSQPLEILMPGGLRRRHVKLRRSYFDDPLNRPMGLGLDLAARRKDGKVFPVEIGLSTLNLATGRLGLAVITDVTERKRLDSAVRQRELELKTLLDNVPDGIVRLDRDIRYRFVNAVVLKVSGLARKSFLGKTPREAGMPEHLAKLWTTTVRRVFRTGIPELIEFAYPGPRQVTEWEALDIPEPAPDGSVESVLCIMREVTEKKRLEAISKSQHHELQALAARLLTAQEDERRRVSRELHDQLCQRLASLSIDIGELASGPAPPEVERLQRLRTLQERVVEASEQARHLAYELHPSVLDDLGLAAALRTLCTEVATQWNVRVSFTHARLPGVLSREIAACLYRIAQEALQNAVKHSSAGTVRVALSANRRMVRLSVRDDGAGFDTQAARACGGLGLIAMEERARVVNGEFSMQSRKGRGTQVGVIIPTPWSNE